MSATVLHREIREAISGGEQTVGLHIEVSDALAQVSRFPRDYITPSLMARVIAQALSDSGQLVKSLGGCGPFNSSNYLFNVRNGRAAAAQVKELMRDRDLVCGALLPMCEIAWWNEGVFEHMHPLPAPGDFTRWFSPEITEARKTQYAAHLRELNEICRQLKQE
jgi:hypothetical protein